MHTLKIIDLSVQVGDKEILKNFNLTIHSGEIHAIMGPNGTGTSTLSKVILGSEDYQVTKGSIFYDGILLNDLKTDERARLGIFLGMQMPPEIEGVTNADFLRTALHEKEQGNFKLMPFIKEMDQVIARLRMDPSMVHRSINQGFSGGERKKNEILQMFMLKPHIVLLDEIDSGLDVDSLKVVGEEVMHYFNQESPAILLITHYQRLLDYIQPHFVHIMIDGAIVNSGDASLVLEIEKTGYDHFKKKSIISASTMKEKSDHE